MKKIVNCGLSLKKNQMLEKKNINYIPEDSPEFHHIKHLLDIFYPKKKEEQLPVLVFIHGGTWMNGSKDIYSTFGRNLANKGVVVAIINYRLGDIVNYKKMASDCAAAVKWVYKNVHDYGGKRSEIYICGHSAGGHLSSLISLDHEYFDQLNIDNPIKGCILNDAFGLNIGNFIKEHGAAYLHYIEKVFTRDPKIWEQASPVKYVQSRKIPFMIFVGSLTYPILISDNEIFYNEIRKYNSKVSYEVVEGKTHVEMVTQLNDKDNLIYEKFLSMLKTQE